MLKTTSARLKLNTNFDTKYREDSGFIKFGIAFWIQRVRFLIHSIFFLLLAQYLTDASCFTVYLKKEKQPDKDIITYNLTEPVTPFKYNGIPHYDPKYEKQVNCPSTLDIPKIERSNDNEGWTT